MGKVEALFGIVFVLTLLCGAALLGVSYFDVAEVTTETQEETVAPVMTTEVILDNQPAVETTSSDEVVEFDAAGEMQYLYMQSENIDASFAELNELQERMYDVSEDYDKVEYDMLQEQIDNERTVAKEYRDTTDYSFPVDSDVEEDPYNRNSGDGEAGY